MINATDLLAGFFRYELPRLSPLGSLHSTTSSPPLKWRVTQSSPIALIHPVRPNFLFVSRMHSRKIGILICHSLKPSLHTNTFVDPIYYPIS